ncbi:hypothetical protein FACS189447_08670 [Spirochaetia bacterium]|nr:hypothetical protein FACS189447_08670 [Spirochaetia bacterium]
MKKNIEHPFIETLGKGPYNYNEIPRGWHVGTCAHCGTGIINNFMIQCADGSLHAVGCECVKQLGLPYEEKTKFEKIVAEQNAEKRRARLEKKGGEARELLQKLFDENADFLKTSFQFNKTSGDYNYIEFCLKHMGDTNIQWLARSVKKLIEGK